MVVIIKWLAHASFQFRADSKIVYVDLGEYSQPDTKADLILVTHSHVDHCDSAKIAKIRKDDTVIIAPSDCVAKLGNIRTQRLGEESSFGNIRVRAVEAYNYKRFRSPGIPFHPKGFGVGYLITINSKTIYHAGDTDFIPEMRQLGLVDVALLPSGGTYTMDNNEAALAAVAINPKIVVPMHRWNSNPEELKKKVEADAKISVVLLKEGEEYKLI